MRHIEDEKRLTHSDDNSRLAHGTSADAPAVPALLHEGSANNETANPSSNTLTHEADNTATDQSANQSGTHDPNAGMDSAGNTLSSKLLHTLDQILPHDEENDVVQAVKHDVLETPAAFIDAFTDVRDMRQRGQRLFFENKDNAETSSGKRGRDSAYGESGGNPQTEPTLSLPYGNDTEAIEDSRLLHETRETPRLSTNTTEKDEESKDVAPVSRAESFYDGDAPDLRSRTRGTGSDNKDYYAMLGVGEDADIDEIKNAYRGLAKKYHPDVNSGDKAAEAKFKEASEAYRVLIDPQKRQAYDERRALSKSMTATGGEKGTGDKPGSKLNHSPDSKLNHTPNAKNGKNPAGGKQKDRFMRRVLDRGYIFSQAATKLMPDEVQDEGVGATGIRSTISEAAKLVKIIATAERKPKESNLRHDDDERLTHENEPDNSRLEHEGIETDEILLLEDSSGRISREAPSSRLLTDGRLSRDGSSGGTTTDSVNPNATSPQSKKDTKIENEIDKNIDKYTARAEKLEKQIKKAEARIPKKKVKKSKLVHNEQTGKTKREISFADEKIDKADAKWNQPKTNTLTSNATGYVTGHASAIIHGKISEAENMTGNTGLKAAHSGEKVIVKTYQTAKKLDRYMKNRPYARLQHLKAKEARNKGKLAYQKLLKDKPELRKKTASRLIQKRRIKREYAKAFRAAQGGAGMSKLGAVGAAVGFGAAAISGDGKAMAKMGAKLALKIAMKKAAVAVVKAVVAVFIKLLPFILIIAAVLLLFTMCASLIGTTTGYVLDAVSYQADADDITRYSVYFTQLEVELKEEIIEAASDVEGLHEFRFTLNSPNGGVDVIFEGVLVEDGLGHPYYTPPVYDPPDFDPLVLLQFLNDITHNPFELMAYLTVLYGNFDGYDINAILREIFDTAFTLEIVEGYEERYAYVEAWHYEEQDLGGYDMDGIWVSDYQDVRVEPLDKGFITTGTIGKSS